MKYLIKYKIFESKDIQSKIDLLQDLSIDLSDEGLYVQITTEDNRFQRKKGINYIYLKIDDKDRILCKDYPEKNDADWLVNYPIIHSFIQRLQDFGIYRDVDYKVFGGGTTATLVFEGIGLRSIKL